MSYRNILERAARDLSTLPAEPQGYGASLTMPSPGFVPGVPTRLNLLARLRGEPLSTPQEEQAPWRFAEMMTGFAGTATPGSGAAAQGIRAYHGSPHRFNRFDMSRIGTGEGAQAYGHGLYFAQAEDVARGYRNALAPARVAVDGNDLGALGQRLAGGARGGVSSEQIQALGRAGRLSAAEQEALYFMDGAPDVASAVRNLREQAAMSWRGPDGQRLWRQRADTLEQLARRIEVTPQGHMYEVNLRVDPSRLLDWDAPLSAQAAPVRDAINRVGRDPRFALQSVPDDMRGVLYRQLVGNPDAVTALRRNGLQGLQYLDAGSRGAGQGTRNYVMFDDSLIDILRRYGIAGLGVGLGGVAAQQ